MISLEQQLHQHEPLGRICLRGKTLHLQGEAPYSGGLSHQLGEEARLPAS